MNEQIDATRVRVPAPRGVPDLEVRVQQPRPGAVLVALHGELGAGTEQVLRSELACLPAGGRGRHVLVDLAGVSAVTADGLGVLLCFQDRIVAAGGQLELLVPPAEVVLMLHDAAHG